MQNDKLLLLPCPFCGGEAQPTFLCNGRYNQIKCKTPKCIMNVDLPAFYGSREEAIEKWNTRKPMKRILEQLESLCKYNSEQAEIYHNAEKPDAHTREMKDLYIERANCYGVAIRTVKGGVDNAG